MWLQEKKGYARTCPFSDGSSCRASTNTFPEASLNNHRMLEFDEEDREKLSNESLDSMSA